MAEPTVHIHSGRVDFEKWHALGNDYLILESATLPFELTERRIRKLCAPHTGVGADGILLLSETDQPGFIARLRIFNPDGSEAALSGNGAREAVLYLRRRGWVETDTFSIQTAAGEMRPTITSPTTCTMDIGRVRLRSPDYPAGSEDGIAELSTEAGTWRFQHVQVGNPQCAIRVAGERELAQLDLPAIGPGVEHHELFPNRTNVSWYTELGPGRIRARIFERGVGETSASGTGATGAAVAYVLQGGDTGPRNAGGIASNGIPPGDSTDSTVIVVLDGGELEVEVGEDLHVNLSGWAIPVFRGTLADEFLKELHETQ
jgi:diaminopimelate epimerase